MKNYSFEEILRLIGTFYGIEGEIKKLPGYVDQNFMVITKDDEKFTFKISPEDTELSEMDFQISLLSHLKKSGFPYDIPEMIRTKEGNFFERLEDSTIIRLQTWVKGRMLDDANPRSNDLLFQWGRVSALLSKHLQGFDHAFAHRFFDWNPSETLHSKKRRKYFQEEWQLELADHFWGLFERKAKNKLKELRKSVNYSDAHEQNLLIDNDLFKPQITGLIDFGDAVYSETINELAIACAYAGMKQNDPIEAWSQLVKAYNQEFPLQEKELALLFYLIGARLMITVASATFNKQREPDNPYYVLSEKPAWDLLKKMKNICPEYVHYVFRNICGFDALPQNKTFKNWLQNNRNDIHPVLALRDKELHFMDLGMDSTELGNNHNFDDADRFEKRIVDILQEANKDIGIGGYGEIRPLYTTDDFSKKGNDGQYWRTLHLGADVWMEAGTPVFAPWDGEVQSVFDNAGERNYGPTIILRHKYLRGQYFYTLYGHLGQDCLESIKKGDTIIKGQKIATIGRRPANGNWPPHLHFQVILDLLDFKDDFPGVAEYEMKEVWKGICPDPSAFFSLKDHSFDAKRALESYSKQDLVDDRKTMLGKNLSLSYHEPLHIVRAQGQYLYDVKGKKFLDTVNNVPHVGHQHPDVVRAGQKQMELLNTNTRYLHENINRYAKELLATFPEELSVVYFVNSGSEANELAYRMVEAYTGNTNMIVVESGYHGNTNACIAMSSYKFDGKGGKGAPEGSWVVPLPDVYRGLHRNKQYAGKQYAQYIGKTILEIQGKDKELGGFLCESILSCAGQIILPEGYLQEAYKLVRDSGGLCIADEVQVGFGRIGEYFWAFELQDVVPDIVTLGKPMGNGHPLAAVVTNKKVAEAFGNGMEYFNTFGGNPVSCAIGLEVLDIIKREKLQENALIIGNYLMDGLGKLQEKYKIIGDVRGKGLFIGIELIRNRNKQEPAKEEAAYLANRMKTRGILMSTDGPDENVLKIKPPLCFNRKDADFLLENLDYVFKEDVLNRGMK